MDLPNCSMGVRAWAIAVPVKITNNTTMIKIRDFLDMMRLLSDLVSVPVS
jgi:putative aminopeptidase FrvX